MSTVTDCESCYKIYKQGQGTGMFHTDWNRGRRGVTLELRVTDLQGPGHCQMLPATVRTAR